MEAKEASALKRPHGRGGDDAVSPVVGVILMVAVCVVLSATVYVFVSGFGIQNTERSRAMALSSTAPLAASGGDQTKSYVVSAASSGLRWTDLRVSVGGASLPYDATPAPGQSSWRVSHDGAALAGEGTAPAGLALAGDVIELRLAGTDASGKTLRIVDAAANAVMTSLAVS